MSKASPSKARRFFSAIWGPWWAKTLIIIILILVVIRLVLSPVATYTANWYLGKKVHGYYGHVKCIHFALYRGAYKLDSIVLNKVDTVTKEQTPFIAVQLIDLSVDWKSIMHKRLVGKVKIVAPEVRFTKDKVEPAQVAKDTTTFRKLVDIGMPLDINRIEIEKGRVRYKDLTSNPQVDISMTDIHALALNLKNTQDSSTLLPSTIDVTADVYGGTVDLKTKLNLLKDKPTFDLKAEVKNLNLPKLNAFFKAYGKFTIDQGDFSLYAEAAAVNGDYKGYLKPLIKDLKVMGPSNKDEKPLTKLWEAVIGAVAYVFTNHNKDQLATKVPFEGTVGKNNTNIVYALFQVVRNAFIEALTPSLDNEINIGTVGKKDEDKPGYKLLHKQEGKEKTAAEKEKDKEKKMGPIRRKKYEEEQKKKQGK